MFAAPARTAVCALTLATGAALVAAPADAAAVSSRVAGYAVSPTTVVKGKTITVKGQAQKLSGRAWTAAPGATATVWFDADGPVANKLQRTVKADARGNFTTSFTAATSGYWSVQLKASTTLKATATSRIYVKVTVPVAAKPVAAKPAGGATSIVMPKGTVNCPSWAPIKGNLSSHIFHMPGQRYYAATHPERCFSTPAAAIAAGFRAAKI